MFLLIWNNKNKLINVTVNSIQFMKNNQTFQNKIIEKSFTVLHTISYPYLVFANLFDV